MSSDRNGTLRPLTPTERSLLDSLPAQDFDGVEELRAQVAHATASSGCECGCGTIALFVPQDVATSSAASPVPVEGAVLKAGGEPIGGLLLFVEDGRWARLEIYSYDEPLPLPVSERVRWETGVQREAQVVAPRPSWWRRVRLLRG